MTSKLPPEQRASIATALAVLQVFRSVDPEMPIGAARSFLLIASEQGLSVTDLKTRSGSALSSASRYHRYLGDTNRRGKPGLGLVKASRCHDDDRRKALRLTPEGRRLMGQLLAAFNAPIRRVTTHTETPG